MTDLTNIAQASTEKNEFELEINVQKLRKLKSTPAIQISSNHTQDKPHAAKLEIPAHANATFDANSLPYLTGTVVIPARASPSQSVISIKISRLMIPAKRATTRKRSGDFIMLVRDGMVVATAVAEADIAAVDAVAAVAGIIPATCPLHKTCQAARPLVTGLMLTNAAQLAFLIQVFGFKCTVYK
mmetsp:Transcript_6917/g.14933  ORF Transcript_6917/g.14933 Transcript_6917/m.14933 type:complete len:185 (+) Transcript_6917:326-880(+)